MEPDFTKGLLTTVVVDATTKDVLMVAWMNEASYRLTKQTGETWFWSRSRQGLWHKGATSGNTQVVKEMWLDCDQDTLLVKVDPAGPACHTGARSCFFNQVQERKIKMQDLESLYQMVAARKANPKEGSYTDYLFTKGLDKILKKVGEETTEVIVAAKNEGTAELQYETADLLYHLMVLLVEQGLTYDDIKEELGKREGLMSDFKDRPEIKDL